MNKNTYYVLAFDSTHDAIYMDKTLRGRISAMIIPVPRSITASCGIALRIEEEHLSEIKNFLTEKEIKGRSYEFYKICNGQVERCHIKV